MIIQLYKTKIDREAEKISNLNLEDDDENSNNFELCKFFEEENKKLYNLLILSNEY